MREERDTYIIRLPFRRCRWLVEWLESGWCQACLTSLAPPIPSEGPDCRGKREWEGAHPGFPFARSLLLAIIQCDALPRGEAAADASNPGQKSGSFSRRVGALEATGSEYIPLRASLRSRLPISALARAAGYGADEEPVKVTGAGAVRSMPRKGHAPSCGGPTSLGAVPQRRTGSVGHTWPMDLPW